MSVLRYSLEVKQIGKRFGLVAALLVSGCATQPAYQRPTLTVPQAWANAVAGAAEVPVAANDIWWTHLHDPAIDELTASAFADSPSLAEAIAKIDEARATFKEAGAQRLPSISASGSATRALSNLQAQEVGSPIQGGAATLIEDTASLGPSLSWELDLWGRLRDTALAARDRLDARNADAAGTRLSLAADIANGVLDLRACNYSLEVRDRDIVSRQTELDLMNKRLGFGNVAPVDVANAATNLANARTDRISQQQQCTDDIDALVELSGRDAVDVRGLIAHDLMGTEPLGAQLQTGEVRVAAIMPTPPPLQPALPATVLLHHPSVISAEGEVAARWSEIGEARADRLPTINLSAMLTGNWLTALGSTITYDAWSTGLSLSAPLFDGGSGAAKVSGAQASYREAVANLRASLRTATQNVEDALAARQSAEQRVVTSQQAVESGSQTLLANEARWRAGSISMFDLEDARRQFNDAQESAITAARDRAEAWVNLVKATGSDTSLDVTANLRESNVQ